MSKAKKILEAFSKLNSKPTKSVNESLIKNVDYLEIGPNETKVVYTNGNEDEMKPSQVFILKGSKQYDLDTVLSKLN